MASAHAHNPFAGLDSDGDEDDTNTSTFVSMDDFEVTPSLRDSQNLTNHSQHSSMAMLESDVIDESELLLNLADSSANRTLQDTSAFVWDLGNPDNEEEDDVAELRTPAQNMPSAAEPSSMKSSDELHNFHLNDDEGLYRASSSNIDGEISETPRVIRNQFNAINSADAATQFDAEPEPTVSVSDAVTSSTIPNFFKLANPYSNIANPNAEEASLILFSRTGPVSKTEIEALSKLATSESTPLQRVVEMLAYTVEFQTHELTNMKYSEIDIASKTSDEQHRRFSEVDRRRSLCIRTLLEELDQKAVEITRLDKKNRETAQKYESEKKFNAEFRSQCENLDSSIRFDEGTEKAFSALNNYLYTSRRKSEATMSKQKMELEEYAERLLELEKKLSASQRRQDGLLNENTSLKVKLAAHTINSDCNHSSVETPAVHCTSNSSVHIDNSVLIQEVTTLTEEAEQLRKEVGTARREKSDIEDNMFKSGIELEETRRKVKSLESQLQEAEANVKMLKEAHDTLEHRSRQVAKELSQNTVNAVRDLDKKEMEIRQLRFELEDREQVMADYRKQIQHLEEQINSATRATISRGMTIASGDGSHNTTEANYQDEKTISTLQEEIESARELLNVRRDELEQVNDDMSRLQNDLKLAMEELHFWKAQANAKSRETEVNQSSESTDVQHDTFLRRLSIKLNCHSENKRDLIRKLVQRIEELIAERVGLEAAKGRLNAQIVEREQKLHAIRSEYETEISALKCTITQVENSRDRAIADRTAAEEKFEEIVKLEDDTEFDDTIDATSSLRLSLAGGSPSIRRHLNLGEDDVKWDDQTIDGAIAAVNQLLGVKLDLASRNESLREKLNNMLSGSFNEDDSRDVLIESRELQEQLLRIIGQQQNTIRRQKEGRRVAFADGHTGTMADEDVTATYSHGFDETTQTFTNTHDFTANMTEDGNGYRSPVSALRSSKATSFLRRQLEEVRKQYTEKMNDNTKLSSIVKDMEHRLEFAMTEKRGSEGRFTALTKLHEKFVVSLGEMLNVRASTVVIESCIRDLLKTISNLRVQHADLNVSVGKYNTRVFKFSAQKRIFEHIIGIYQRKYQLNLLALPPRAERSTKNRLRSVFWAVLAGVRLSVLVRGRITSQNANEYIDLSSVYNLPSPWRIADTRSRSMPFTSAYLAIQSNSKLQAALAEREQEINELRQTLATLDTRMPSADHNETDFARSATFDYSQEVLDRKNEIARRLHKALQEKEELEVRLRHEKLHRASSEARATKYLEKASKLHTKLQTVKLTAENRERTYKAAIRYLKQKADSGIDVEFENSEPNKSRAEASSSGTPADVKTRQKHFASMMHSQLRSAQEKLETMQHGTKEYKDQQVYINGLRSTVKRLRKTSTSITKTSTSTSTTTTTSSKLQTATADTESREEAPAA